MDNLQQDLSFIKEKTDTPLQLPEGLAQENIVNAVKGKKQKTPVKTLVRRYVAVAVAACIMICSFVIYDAAVYRPSVYVDENQAAKTDSLVYATDYVQLGKMLNDYRKSLEFPDRINLYSVKEKLAVATDEAANDFVYSTDSVAATGEATVAAAENGASTTASDNTHSDTNVRTQGVLEADIIKTDGKYLYVLDTDSTLHIVTADSTPMPVSETDVRDFILPTAEENSSAYAVNFYIRDNMLIIVGNYYSYDENYNYRTNQTVYLFADITDPASPKPVHKVSYEGNVVDTRVIGDRLVSITSFSSRYDGFDINEPASFIPSYQVEDGEKVYAAAESIAIVNTEHPDTFITVSEISLSDFSLAPQNLTLLGNGWEVYCTAASLYVYYDNWEITDNGDYLQQTHLLSFDIAGDTPRFVAKTCLPGRPLNTWSLDEYNGCLRLAVTDGNGEKTVNYVYILNNALEEVGKTEAFAEGESLYAVRFSGSTAYAVTFYRTDPLFVLDLSDVTKPVITGELKLPGFSSYLHPVGENLLLGVGVGGDDKGTDGSAKLSLFDVSDPKNPTECDSLIIADGYFNTDYKAFVTMGQNGYLLPLTQYSTVQENEDGYYYNYYRETVGILQIAVENNKIVEKNRFILPESEEDDWYYYDVRAAFVNDTVFAVNYMDGIGVTAFDQTTGEISGRYEKYDREDESYYPYMPVD